MKLFNLSKIAVLVLVSSVATVTFAKSTHNMNNYKDAGYKDAPCPTPPMLMGGFYVGAQAGYDAFRVRASTTNAAVNSTAVGSVTGWMGGLFAGYGQYFNNYYLGGELLGNYNGSNQTVTSGNNNDGDSWNVKAKAKGTWGIALLPGMKLNDATLAYVRLGYDWTKFESNSNAVDGTTTPNTTYSGSGSKTESGFDFGVGLETLVYQNWSVRTEYNHIWYSSFSAGNTSLNPSDNQFAVGVLYHFA